MVPKPQETIALFAMFFLHLFVVVFFMEGSVCTLKTSQFQSCGIFFFFFLTFWLQHSMWGLSSLTKNRTQASCIGSMESQRVDHQGSPSSVTFEERDLTHWWEWSHLCRSQGQSWPVLIEVQVELLSGGLRWKHRAGRKRTRVHMHILRHTWK